jgi:para-nitrobenzyl esterase
MRFSFSSATRRRGVAAAALAIACSCVMPPAAAAAQPDAGPQIELMHGGKVEGVRTQIGDTEVKVFRGIPYAAPPIGAFRWREPQPVARWAGALAATDFAPRCMQLASPSLDFRSQQMSENCLYLNVWTPARSDGEKLPVLVYFHGGGFDTGDGSEARYDGANLSTRGIVTVTANYRLGVFGFLALPESAGESPHATVGNYGLLDQVAVLRWVRENISRFGGDPDQVTIAGESSGAMSVNAHMASPLSRGLFARAIGSSGGAFSPTKFWERSEANEAATQFAEHVGADSLQALRALSAEQLLSVTGPAEKPAFQFWPSVDGHFLPSTPESQFASGAQARVPLLIGNNNLERDFRLVLGSQAHTPEVWRQTIKTLFREHADEALIHYPGNDEDEVLRSANALAGDLFVAHSTWRWMDMHRKTAHAPVYFYEYTHSPPPERAVAGRNNVQPAAGAPHGAEIEYALANLDSESRFARQSDNRKVSSIFSGYIAQFVKTGNPNGGGLPKWPAVREEQDAPTRQSLGTQTYTFQDRRTAQQAFIQEFFNSR